jgi:hypothetical protein
LVLGRLSKQACGFPHPTSCCKAVLSNGPFRLDPHIGLVIESKAVLYEVYA